MKARHIRLYSGDIRPYLRQEQLKVTQRGMYWRAWVAWEKFPQDGGSGGSLKLAGRAKLAAGKLQVKWLIDPPTAALQRLLAWWERWIKM